MSVARGPICECDQAECMAHVPAGAWDDLLRWRERDSRILVVLPDHVNGDSVVVFRDGWTVVVPSERTRVASA